MDESASNKTEEKKEVDGHQNAEGKPSKTPPVRQSPEAEKPGEKGSASKSSSSHVTPTTTKTTSNSKEVNLGPPSVADVNISASAPHTLPPENSAPRKTYGSGSKTYYSTRQPLFMGFSPYYSVRHPSDVTVPFYGPFSILLMRRLQDKFDFGLDMLKEMLRVLAESKVPFRSYLSATHISPHLKQNIEVCVIREILGHCLIDDVVRPYFETINHRTFGHAYRSGGIHSESPDLYPEDSEDSCHEVTAPPVNAGEELPADSQALLELLRSYASALAAEEQSAKESPAVVQDASESQPASLVTRDVPTAHIAPFDASETVVSPTKKNAVAASESRAPAGVMDTVCATPSTRNEPRAGEPSGSDVTKAFSCSSVDNGSVEGISPASMNSADSASGVSKVGENNSAPMIPGLDLGSSASNPDSTNRSIDVDRDSVSQGHDKVENVKNSNPNASHSAASTSAKTIEETCIGSDNDDQDEDYDFDPLVLEQDFVDAEPDSEWTADKQCTEEEYKLLWYYRKKWKRPNLQLNELKDMTNFKRLVMFHKRGYVNRIRNMKIWFRRPVLTAIPENIGEPVPIAEPLTESDKFWNYLASIPESRKHGPLVLLNAEFIDKVLGGYEGVGYNCTQEIVKVDDKDRVQVTLWVNIAGKEHSVTKLNKFAAFLDILLVLLECDVKKILQFMLKHDFQYKPVTRRSPWIAEHHARRLDVVKKLTAFLNILADTFGRHTPMTEDMFAKSFLLFAKTNDDFAFDVQPAEDSIPPSLASEAKNVENAQANKDEVEDSTKTYYFATVAFYCQRQYNFGLTPGEALYKCLEQEFGHLYLKKDMLKTFNKLFNNTTAKQYIVPADFEPDSDVGSFITDNLPILNPSFCVTAEKLPDNSCFKVHFKSVQPDSPAMTFAEHGFGADFIHAFFSAWEKVRRKGSETKKKMRTVIQRLMGRYLGLLTGHINEHLPKSHAALVVNAIIKLAPSSAPAQWINRFAHTPGDSTEINPRLQQILIDYANQLFLPFLAFSIRNPAVKVDEVEVLAAVRYAPSKEGEFFVEKETHFLASCSEEMRNFCIGATSGEPELPLPSEGQSRQGGQSDERPNYSKSSSCEPSQSAISEQPPHSTSQESRNSPSRPENGKVASKEPGIRSPLAQADSTEKSDGNLKPDLSEIQLPEESNCEKKDESDGTNASETSGGDKSTCQSSKSEPRNKEHNPETSKDCESKENSDIDKRIEFSAETNIPTSSKDVDHSNQLPSPALQNKLERDSEHFVDAPTPKNADATTLEATEAADDIEALSKIVEDLCPPSELVPDKELKGDMSSLNSDDAQISKPMNTEAQKESKTAAEIQSRSKDGRNSSQSPQFGPEQLVGDCLESSSDAQTLKKCDTETNEETSTAESASEAVDKPRDLHQLGQENKPDNESSKNTAHSEDSDAEKHEKSEATAVQNLEASLASTEKPKTKYVHPPGTSRPKTVISIGGQLAAEKRPAGQLPPPAAETTEHEDSGPTSPKVPKTEADEAKKTNSSLFEIPGLSLLYEEISKK